MSITNERYIERIDAALPRIPEDSGDRGPLEYIKTQLTPERVKWREEHEVGGEQHLREVANQRLRPYEQKEAPSA